MTPSSWVEVAGDLDPLIFSGTSAMFYSSSSTAFPYLHTVTDVFPHEEVRITVRFKYGSGGYNFGSGIVITDELLTERVNNISDSKYKTQVVWPLAGNKLGVFSTLCPSDQPGCTQEYFKILETDLLSDWHEWSVVFKDEKYQVYFDGVFMYESVSTEKRPRHIWIGNPEITSGPVIWSTFQVDWVKVESLESGGSEDRNKVILLPGLGGSWNTESLIMGVDNSDENWRLTPFTRVYNDLISTFESNGYVQGDDLFVYTYDWRDPVVEISQRLGGFIEDNFTIEDKIDLVGHSLGGLVARTYEQTEADARVEQVVTAGSPHEGAVQAYVAWAGGQIGEKRSLADVALGIYLRLQAGIGKNNWEVVEESVPVVKDIMPSFNFAYRGADLLPLSQMSVSNDFLINLNLDQEGLYPKLEALVGMGEATPGKVILDQRTLYDQILGLWPDGSFLGYQMENGDRTVLFESAKFGEDPFWSLPETHGGLVSSEEGINSIMDILGLEGKGLGSGEDNWGDTLLFMIGSPAEMTVFDPDVLGFSADDQGIVSISPVVPGPYIVSVSGQEDGVYHLLSGVLGGEFNYFEAKISSDQDDYYTFLVSEDGRVEPIDFDGLMWLRLARDLINNRLPVEEDVNLEEAILSINEAMDSLSDCELGYEKVGLAIENLFLYRFLEVSSESRNISGEVINYLVEAGTEFGICGGEMERERAEETLTEARQLKALVNAKLRLGVERGGGLGLVQAEAYKKAEGLLVEMVWDLAEGDYWKVEMKGTVVKFYLQEAVGTQIW